MQNHNDAMKTSEDTFFEKYTSHFIWKGSEGLLNVLLCESWVGDRIELQHIDPHSYGHNSVSFPYSWAAQPGFLIPASLQLIWGSELQLLNQESWGPPLLGAGSLYSILFPTELELPVHRVILLFYAHSIQPVDSQGRPLIPSTGCTFYFHRCIYYFDSSAGVNMQHN